MEKTTVKTVGMMMLITLIGKALGLVREMLFGFHYGTGSIEAIAFTAANQIPKNFLDAMFASVISASFIPIFNEYYERKGRDEAYSLSYNFVSIILLFTFVLTAVGMIFSGPIADWYVAAEAARSMAEELLRIMFPLLILSGAAYALIGVVQSLGEFNIPAAMSIVSNGIILVYYFFFIDRFGVYGLALVFLLGWLLQLVIQIPFLNKNKFRFRFRINFREEGIKKIALLMLPVMISTWIQPVNLTINAKIASGLFRGAGLTALNYANTLYTVITGVFILSIANVIFPKLSKQTVNGEREGFDATLGTTIHALFYFLIPMTFGLIALSEPLVKIVFELGGQFDAFSTMITARALAMYSIGILGFGLQTILARGFYAQRDGMTPLFTSGIAILVNLALSILLVKPMDVGGVALASSISLNLTSFIMLIVMRKKGMSFFDMAMFFDIIKITLTSVIMFVIVTVSRGLFSTLTDSLLTRLIVLAVPASLGLIFFLLASWRLRLSESLYIFAALRKILLKR